LSFFAVLGKKRREGKKRKRGKKDNFKNLKKKTEIRQFV